MPTTDISAKSGKIVINTSNVPKSYDIKDIKVWEFDGANRLTIKMLSARYGWETYVIALVDIRISSSASAPASISAAQTSINTIFANAITQYGIEKIYLAELTTDFDFTDPNNVTLNGSAVASIIDKAGGVTSAQGTGALQPAYSATGGPDNRGYATFSGGKYLTGSLLQSGLPHSIIVIRRPAVGTLNAALSIFSNGTASNGYGIVDNDSATFAGVSGVFQGVSAIGAGKMKFSTDWKVSAFTHSAGVNKIYDFTGQAYTIQSGATVNPSTPTTRHDIGRLYYGSAYNGDIARILLYSKELSQTEVREIFKYLKSTYSLTLPKYINFGGDSITAGGAVALNSEYPNQIMDSLNATDYCYSKISGVSGRLSADVYNNLTTEVLQNFNDNNNYNIYCLLVGHNDIASGLKAPVIYNKIRVICQAARAAGFKVITQTVLISTNETGTPAYNTEWVALNGFIRNNWGEFADAFLDLAVVTNLTDPSNTTYYLDGTHPTAAGNTLIANALVPVIQNLL